MDLAQAREIAARLIGERVEGTEAAGDPGSEFVICHEEVTDDPPGWVFGYTTRGYLETGDLRYAIVGNCPVWISQKRRAIMLPTFQSIERSLAELSDGVPFWLSSVKN